MSAQLPHLRDHVAMGVFDAFQIPYSAVERDHEEVIVAASATGAAIIVRGVVARGSLADRVDRPAESLRGAVQQGLVLWDDHDVDELLDGASWTEFLVRFAITHPSVQCALVGTVDPQHLADDLAAAAKGPLPADVDDEARRRLDPTGARPLDSVRSVSALPDQSPDRTRSGGASPPGPGESAQPTSPLGRLGAVIGGRDHEVRLGPGQGVVEPEVAVALDHVIGRSADADPLVGAGRGWRSIDARRRL